MFLEDRNKSAGVTAPADPWTLGALIVWLQTKPAGEIYCYMDNGHCLMGQYLIHLGYERGKIYVGGWGYSTDGSERESHNLPEGWPNLASMDPHTFGGALSRALAIQGAK